MTRHDITPEQAKQIADSLFPQLNYLFRLKKRMEETAFPVKDPLFVLVNNAYDAVQRLRVAVHYQSCGMQTGPEADGK